MRGGFKAPGFIVVPVSSYNIPEMASDETLLVGRIDQRRNDYSEKVDDWAILVTDPSFAPQADASAGQRVILADRLVNSYNVLVELNGQIGAASREQSKLVMMQLAFFYGGIASAISAACATAAVILVSKRIVLGDLVRMSKLELAETSLRDLAGGGAAGSAGLDRGVFGRRR